MHKNIPNICEGEDGCAWRREGNKSKGIVMALSTLGYQTSSHPSIGSL